MSEDLSIQTQLGHGLRLFFYSQIFITPPYPTQSFADQTVIVTGSNAGLGLEAARHFYKLNCAKLILAVRSIENGKTAKEDIVQSVKRRTDAGTIEVWPLDLGSTVSTLAFSERIKRELIRVDVMVENAGVHNKNWETLEGYEKTIQVNVINTFLLALLILPKMQETKRKFRNSSPYLVVVTSEAHRLSKFKEINAPDIYEALNNPEGYNGQERYETSKLLEVLFIRELVSRLRTSTSSVTINLVNPGLCHSTLNRSDVKKPLVVRILTSVLRPIFYRTAEVGARNFVYSASAGSKSDGEYISDSNIQEVEAWIYEDVGKRAQKKVFEQTMKVLEGRKPGVGKEVGF